MASSPTVCGILVPNYILLSLVCTVSIPISILAFCALTKITHQALLKAFEGFHSKHRQTFLNFCKSVPKTSKPHAQQGSYLSSNINFLYQQAFPLIYTITNTQNLKERSNLTHVLRRFSLQSAASKVETLQQKGISQQTCSVHSTQKAKENITRGEGIRDQICGGHASTTQSDTLEVYSTNLLCYSKASQIDVIKFNCHIVFKTFKEKTLVIITKKANILKSETL